MPRNRSSAKKAGSLFESQVAGFLRESLEEDGIERRSRNGKSDRGDITGVRTALGERVVIECKNTSRIELGVWAKETEIERGNDDAAVGVIVHKRVGRGEKAMGDQWVTMTLSDFSVLLGGAR